MPPEILRLTAFADDPAGGNPAGVVLDARGLDAAAMQAIAADLGYSESAFVVPGDDPDAYGVRYFSPQAEVPFCGHATIATAVALAGRDGAGTFTFRTASGDVLVEATPSAATLTSVPASTRGVADADLIRALELLRWNADELDPSIPPGVAFAGAHHLVLAALTRERLAHLDYDFEGLRKLMLRLGLVTVALVHRETPELLHARNPFPVGGVVEDPATGAAAAAVGAHLRAHGLLTPPARFDIHQGDDLGRPSRLRVELRADDDRVRVTGAAVSL